jgi:hypothetical protein
VNLISQMPEKSTLPSAVRGAGAVRLGWPSASRGTSGVVYFGHCAETDADTAANNAKKTILPATDLIQPPLIVSLRS